MRRAAALLLAVALAAPAALVEPAQAWLKAGPNVVSAHHRLRTPGGVVDMVGAPASAAYSFRLLKTGYAGKAVQLRRASDNAVLDIGFTAGGDFDAAAAATHCSATSCFLAKWYDQSGNARDAVQAVAATQLAFIFNCNGTLPCARGTGAATQNVAAANVTPATGVMSLDVVYRRTSGTSGCYWITNNSTNSINSGAAGFLNLGGGAGSISPAATEAAWHTGIGVINGASSFMRVDNNAEVGGSVTGSVAAGPIQVNYTAAGSVCEQTEAIIWDGYALTPAERTALTANQIAYWMPAPLDTFSAPAAAYSLRKLKSTYAGPAIRLRRASDNAEQDINFLGFVPGLGSPLDVAAANVFCAATSCFIKTWYDQSGNARDQVQATAANQPAFVFNCQGSLPCLQTTSGTIGMSSVANITPATGLVSFSVVAKRAGGPNFCTWMRENGVSNNFITQNSPNTWALNGGAGGTVFPVAADSSFHTGQGVVNGASSVVNIDGTETTGTANGATTAGQVQISGGGSTTCNHGEAIVWDNYALTAAERAALTANQRSFWGF